MSIRKSVFGFMVSDDYSINRATADYLYKNYIVKDSSLIDKILSVKGITKKRDEYEVSANIQEVLYDHFNYWSMKRFNKLMFALENAEYLDIANDLWCAKKSGEL